VWAPPPDCARVGAAGVPVVVVSADVRTLPDGRVVTAPLGVTRDGFPAVTQGDWVLDRAGHGPVSLGGDLLAAIRSEVLGQHLGISLDIGQESAVVRPQARPVRWAGDADAPPVDAAPVPVSQRSRWPITGSRTGGGSLTCATPDPR
jgi:hypothetical protein